MRLRHRAIRAIIEIVAGNDLDGEPAAAPLWFMNPLAWAGVAVIRQSLQSTPADVQIYSELLQIYEPLDPALRAVAWHSARHASTSALRGFHACRGRLAIKSGTLSLVPPFNGLRVVSRNQPGEIDFLHAWCISQFPWLGRYCLLY